MCGPVSFKIRKVTIMCLRSLLKRFPYGRFYIYAVDPSGTLTTSTTLDKPLLRLEGMTGFIDFELGEGSRLSDYWQQRTKSQRTCNTQQDTLHTCSCPC